MMPRRVRRAAFIIAAALCVPVLPFVLIGELPGEHWLSMNDAHALPFAGVGAGLLALDMLLPVPSSVIGTLLGARLGLVAGFVSAFAGLMVGQAAAFSIARRLVRDTSETLPEAPALVAVFLSRPVPVVAEAVVLAAGAARLGWAPFLLANAAGNAVYAAALALAGSQLLPGALAGPGLLLPMLVPAAAWALWRRQRRASPGESPRHALPADQPHPTGPERSAVR